MALVITRKNGQALHIGDDIKVTVYTDPQSSQVKLAIEAPKEVVILREELLDNPAKCRLKTDL